MVGENVTFSANMVTSVEDNDVNLTTSNSLEIESNWFDHDFILNVIGPSSGLKKRIQTSCTLGSHQKV